MTKFYTFFTLLTLTVSLFSINTLAQEQYAEEELYDLSLEELLHVKVTTASKTAETIQNAPGVVSVVTAKEIESYGATNLNEVLDRVAGLYVTSSFTNTGNLVSIRGETNAHWATKVLVLIEGRPYRESLLGGNLINVLNGYPLGIVEKIEIVRGPGSVLYGTNAFMGVINVILKKSAKNYFTTSSRYGSFNTRQTNITTGIKRNDLTVDASLNLYNTDGWRFTARDEKAIIRSHTTPVYDSIINPARTIYKDRDDIGMALHSAYKGFVLNAFYGRSVWQTMDINSQWIVPANGSLTAKPIRYEGMGRKLFIDLGYEKEITDHYTTSMNITWNKTWLDHRRGDYVNKPVVTLANDALAEWSNRIKLRDNLNVIAGIVINNQTGHFIDETKNADGTPYSDNTESVNSNWLYVAPQWNETWYSGYAQLAYKPISTVKVVGGLQANKVEGIDLHYSPRIAAIFETKAGMGGKLLYGSAFRSATPGAEKAINIQGVLHGNANLKPEIINTSEIQLFMVRKKIEASINYFYSEVSDLIVRSRKDDPDNQIPGTPQYINGNGKLTSHGIEAETKFYLNAQWSGMGSFATQSSEDDQGRKNYSGAPLSMVKAGIHYNGPRGIDIALFCTHYSKGGNIQAVFSADNTPDNFDGKAIDANPAMKAVNYITANVQLNLPELLKSPEMADVTLFCYLVNLLDQQVNYPEFTRRVINAYPGRAGFNIHGGVKVKL